MNGRSKVLTWGLPIVGVAALIAGTGMVIENRPVNPEEDPPRQPTTSPSVAMGEGSASYIGAIGTTEPAGEAVAIAAHTSGVVEAVRVSVGDRVEAGGALFVVDRTRSQTEVALRSTQVTVAEQDLASLRAAVLPLEASVTSAQALLESAQAEVNAVEAQLRDRENQLRIATSVSDSRAISSEEVDRRRFAVEQTQAQLATAAAGVRQAEAGIVEASAELSRYRAQDGSDGPVLIAASARVEQAKRVLEQSAANLELLTVRSPIAATVLQVNTRAGEFASASVPTEGLIVLGSNGAMHLRVEIDEVDIPRFTQTAKAWASPRGNAAARIPLTLAYVEPLVVPKGNLSGRTRELVDTRVLQVVYTLDQEPSINGIGRQYDVYIEAQGGDS